MARVRYDEVDQYTTSTTNFFQLKEDRDVATVRILYNNVDDIEAHSLHRVKINGRDKWVECLRQINDSVEVCPLCASGNKIQLRVFVPLYIEDDGSVKLWERGKKFIDKLTSLCARYNPLCSQSIEIERNGAKGEQTTEYLLFPIKGDDKTLEDFPEVPEVPETFLLNKTAEELDEFLDTGKMPGLEEQSQRRNPATAEGVKRRTPAEPKARRNRRESF